MLLKQLLKNLDYTLVQGCLNTEVTDIYYDSRKVTPGGCLHRRHPAGQP